MSDVLSNKVSRLQSIRNKLQGSIRIATRVVMSLNKMIDWQSFASLADSKPHHVGSGVYDNAEIFKCKILIL